MPCPKKQNKQKKKRRDKHTVWLHDTINTAWLTYCTDKRQSCSMRRAGEDRGEVKLEVGQKKWLVIAQRPALVVRRGGGWGVVTCGAVAGSAGGSHRVGADSKMVAGPWCESASHHWTAQPAPDSHTMSYKYTMKELLLGMTWFMTCKLTLGKISKNFACILHQFVYHSTKLPPPNQGYTSFIKLFYHAN